MTGSRPIKPALQAFELRSIDPARRRARRYHIAEMRTLFDEPALLITWGRIGARARVRLETFASAEGLLERRQELLARRRAHGYVLISCL